MTIKTKNALDKLTSPEWQGIHHFVYKMNSMFPWVGNHCPTPFDFAEVLESCGLEMVQKNGQMLDDQIIADMALEFLVRGFTIDSSDERVEDGIRPCFEVTIDMTCDLEDVTIVRKDS